MEEIKTTITDGVNELLAQLGVDASVMVVEQEGAYQVNITCVDDPSLLIGKHAEGLLAIQRVMQIMLYKKFPDKVEITIDINGYRERQKSRLNQIAQNVAERVSSEGRSSMLRSFSAYERKIIHEYISVNFPQLSTRSEGEEPDRVIVISSKTGDDSMAALEEEFNIEDNI